MFKKKKLENPNPDVSMPEVHKKYSRRLFMLVIGGVLALVGAGLFVIYFFTLNMVFGAPGVFLAGGGIWLFFYYWGKTGDVVTEHLGKVSTLQVNSLVLYKDKVVFADVAKPEGFPMKCRNDKKKYFVYIEELVNKRLIPFILPDQQYFDPGVFAERVLGLPAHRKIFMRKETLLHVLKIGLLILGIIIMWIVILTTTGGK